MGKSTFSNKKYSPVCQRCFKVIKENSPAALAGGTGLHFRKGLSVCKECKDILDGPTRTVLDIEYKRALLKHTLGDENAIITG